MKNEERTSVSKNKIINAATIEFANNGYDNFSMNQLCANHSITKGRLYYHFEGKEQLFFACVEKCYLQLIETIKSFKADPGVSYEKNLHNYFHLRQDYFELHPHSALLIHQALQNSSESFKENLSKIRSDFQTANSNSIFEILKDVNLQRGVSINIIIKTFELASNYVHFVHGVPNWKAGGDNTAVLESSLKIFDDVMQILLYGILPREEI